MSIILPMLIQAQTVTMALPHPPQYVKNSNGVWLVYDLHVSATGKFEPKRITITNPKQETVTETHFQLLAKDSTAYVTYIWIKTQAKKTSTLRNTLTYQTGTQTKQISQEIKVFKNKPLSVNWPVILGKWLAANAPDKNSEHTNTTIKIGAKVYDSLQNGWILGHNCQRFAIDFVSMDNEGKLFKGNGTKNEDWFCYGTPIHAVATGIVLKITDSINDNQMPGKIDYKITKNNIGGNAVFINLGNGNIAFYGHLQKNSITVKKGDAVKKGQIIGRLGNSGQSTAPHLHFHLTEQNKEIPLEKAFNGLAYEGIPYYFKTYQSYGTAKDDFWTEDEDGTQTIKPFSFTKPTSKSIPVNFEVIEIQ